VFCELLRMRNHYLVMAEVRWCEEMSSDKRLILVGICHIQMELDVNRQ
jgi:hypothetical protein